MQEENREAGIEGIARRMHDPRLREERLDEPDQQEVVGSLVRYTMRAGEEVLELPKVALCECAEGLIALAGHPGREGAEGRLDQRWQEVELPACADLPMP